MNLRRLVLSISLTAFFCLPLYLLSEDTGAPPRRTGGNFPGESSCATSDCHGGTANTGPGSVSVSIDGVPAQEYRYTPGGGPVPVAVAVSDPAQQRWGFEITARTDDGCGQAGAFSPVDAFVQVVLDRDDPAPCPEASIEFPTHTFPKAGSSGATFDLNWTPPPTDIGPVIFAAAGNAANGDNDNSGDNIYTTQTTVTANAGPGAPTPSINTGGVVIGNLLPTVSSISPNAIISVFGQDFAPEGTARDLSPEDLVDNKVPTVLAGVCAEVNGTRSPVLAVRPTQLNLQAPTLEVQGPVSVEVIADCGTPDERRSAAEMVVMNPLAPAFFVKNFNDLGGANPIATLHQDGVSEVGDPNVIPGATPAAPGEFVSLFATGFGLTTPVFQAGVIPQIENPGNPTAPIPSMGAVSATIGGIPLVNPDDIFYVGVAPCCAGLYQLILKVPDDAPDGDLPVVVAVDGVSTPEGPFITVQRP